MKKIVVTALASLLVASFASAGRTDASVLSVVRVHVDSEAEAGYLMSNFDETHNHGPNEIELLLWPGDLAELDALGLDYEVVVEDLVAHDRALEAASDATPVPQPGPDRTEYRRLGDYNAEMQELADKNKGLVELFEMKRPSLEGRTIYGVEIAADVKDKFDGRPIFYLDAEHHAREWPASEFTMIYAHYLVEEFGKNPQITKLLRKARVIVVPVVNVDGFDFSRESVTSAHPAVASNTDFLSSPQGWEGYWRKNRRSLTGVTAPAVERNPDAYGVDPNRNYSYLWGDNQGGSSGSQLNETYRGTEPFSEPEVANVRDIILNRNTTGVITNHTYQSSVLRAGGGDSPEDAILESLGQEMADVLGYQNNGTVGYPTTGTTDDWSYAVTGGVGFTIEHGTQGFHPPYGDFVLQHNDKVSKAFTIMLEAVANPKYHSVLTGRVHGGPAKLTLTKTMRVPLSEGNPTGEEFVVEKIRYTMSTGKDGRFEWHVGPSTSPWNKKKESYTLTIKGKGGTAKMPVTVDRGERLNLGTFHLGNVETAALIEAGEAHDHDH
ncbi:MAG TPA: M14 family zinc carboxypeptidase [Actinomycetota bacterium]|nr:M14 family zinc carboxypeptidase [Actinomycetota bacterium]